MKKCFKVPQPFYLLSFNQYVAEKREKRLKIAFHFGLKFQMENALFLGLHPQRLVCENSFMVVSLRQKRPPNGEERGEKSMAIFEKKKKCKGNTFVAQKTSAYTIFFRPHRVIN